MKNKNKLNGKTILIVNTGSNHKKFIFQKLKKLGVNTVVLNREKNWADSYVQHWIIADTNNYNDSLSAVKKFLAENPEIKLDGVVTFWEESVLLTSQITDFLGLPGIPYSISSNVRNKYLFRNFCSDNGIRAPKHLLIKDVDNISKEVEDLTFPVVIKPVFGSSSAFVIKVETKEEIPNILSYIKKTIATHPDSSEWDSLEFLVEEYIDGNEVDIDMVVQNGKIKLAIVSDNSEKNRGKFFLDSEQTTPSNLPKEEQNELIQLAEVTLEKLQIFNGIIHFEAKYSSKGPVPLEINLRMGGDYVYTYIKTAWNVDLIELSLLLAIGDYIEPYRELKNRLFVIGKDIVTEESGIISEFDLDEALKNRFVKDKMIYKELGDPILVPPEGFETAGWITVSGDNPIDMRDNLDEVLEQINFNVVPFDNESFVGRTVRKDKFSTAKLNKQMILKSARLEKFRKLKKKDLKKLSIAVVGDLDDSRENIVNNLMTLSTKDVITTLQDNGYKTSLYKSGEPDVLLHELKSNKIDLVINLTKKMGDALTSENKIASIIDLSMIPYTGSDIFPLTISKDKITFKKLLTFHNIPTPNWDYLYDLDEDIDEDLEYPLIVKPANRNNSIGITNNSVVNNEKELRKQVKKIMEEFKSPVIVEEYIEGDEYSIVILGNDNDDYKILPLRRTIFDNLPKDYWHILSYDAKWNKDKVYENLVVQNPPHKMSKKLEKLISEIALDVYSITRCRDYGQVEIKLDDNDNPYVLELNTNPFLNKGNIVAKSAEVAKIDYLELLEEIIMATIKRYNNQSTILF